MRQGGVVDLGGCEEGFMVVVIAVAAEGRKFEATREGQGIKGFEWKVWWPQAKT